MVLEKVEENNVKHVAPVTSKPWSWKGFLWDTLDKSPEERRMLFKLDATLVTFGCLGTFIKYLDRSNINNAFDNGMKEDLSLYGNELNYQNTCYAVANIIGLWPVALVLSRTQPRFFIPFLEFGWTICTFGQAWMKTPLQMYVLRTILGLFECGHYSAIAYLAGSWYTRTEMAKRMAIINGATAIGPMFSGYLQAAVFKGLNGKHGMAGWQWLYIIDGVISIGVIIPQLWLLPDTVARQKPGLLFTAAEIELARDRMPQEGRVKQGRFTLRQMRTWLNRPDLWALWLISVCNSIGNFPSQSYPFWLKAWNSRQPGSYSIPQINLIPTAQAWMVIVVTLSSAWVSDSVLNGSRWQMLVLGGVVNGIINILLSATPLFPGNRAFRHFLYIQSGWLQAVNSMFWTWTNESFRGDPGHRAFAVSGLNVWAWLAQATVPPAIFQTKYQPDVSTGNYVAAAFCFLSPITAVLVWQFQKRYLRPVSDDELIERAAAEREQDDTASSDYKAPLGDEERDGKVAVEQPVVQQLK